MDAETTSNLDNSSNKFLLSRRQLLAIAAALPVSNLVSAENSSKTPPPPSEKPQTTQALDDKWQTVSALLDHLLPSSEDFPGATEIHALNYFQKKFQRPLEDPSDEDFLFRGIGWLTKIADNSYKSRFIDMPFDQKEALIKKIAATGTGENWLAMIINNLIEALLTDPVYGGNTDSKGWQAIGHIPGYPHSPEGKRFYETGYRKRKVTTFRSTKA